MEEQRPDSGQLLKRLQYEEREQQKKNRGKLKIFLGYAAGSGKTYAMLKAAHEAKEHGIDVVAGYIEPHARPDTQALTEGLEMLSPLMLEYKGVRLREFDLDAALQRKPQLILVDELAHTNAKGCRNEKRYQDVKELLRMGINVYTTINIQHLESLNDLVGNITHIDVRERIPDTVFDHADQVEVIDIEPEDLIQRMKEGKIYQGPRQRGHFRISFGEKNWWLSGRSHCGGRQIVSTVSQRKNAVFWNTRITIQENISWFVSQQHLPVQRSSGRRQDWQVHFMES